MVLNFLYGNKSCISCVKNERGTALIVALLLLAIMTILGTILMSTSQTEIQLSGNYRNSQKSFYAADRAIQYSMQSASSGSGVVDLYVDQDALAVLHRDRIAIDQSGLEVSVYSEGADDRNSVVYIASSPPPVGSGSDAALFKARNYAANTVGVFPVNAANPSRTKLGSQFAKIVPK